MNDHDLPPWTRDYALSIQAGLGSDPLHHGPGLLHALQFAKTIAKTSIKTAEQLDGQRPQYLEHVLDDGEDYYAEAIRRVPWEWIEWIRAHPDAVIPAESPAED